VIVDGNNAVTVFTVNDGLAVTLNALTIQHGSGSLGGGISGLGSPIKINSLTVTNSTISGNGATGEGGGIYNSGGNVTVTNSTISGNNSAGRGGGISNVAGGVTLTNSTVTGNTATSPFGPVRGGGIYSGIGGVSLTNTIAAGNTAPNGPDLTASFATGGHNLIGTTSGATIPLTTGDIVNPTPLLGALGSYGGPTQTIPLLPGSPAIDAGDDAVCASTTTPVGAAVSGEDQRGISRPFGTHCDIGAFENAVPTALPGSRPTGTTGGPTPNPISAGRP
jgi:hypothetical protein